jgi:hypothetical protein
MATRNPPLSVGLKNNTLYTASDVEIKSFAVWAAVLAAGWATND